jgi:hypothetical protein
MAPQQRLGILHPSTNNPFAHPGGWLGRLAGRIMLWTNKQDDVIGVLGVQPGDDVLEIGHGRGGLIRLLVERTEAVRTGASTRPRRCATKPHGTTGRPFAPGGFGSTSILQTAPGCSSRRHRHHRLARRHDTVAHRQVPAPAGGRARPHRASAARSLQRGQRPQAHQPRRIQGRSLAVKAVPSAL